ncbi:Endoplasmic reticulum-Golgi intermediate compartment protein 2-like [Oopsacas minuta]|uniref:Endoplasmic reticulum-Golgi intermediate compartment protein 2-like n=1 Tax=Oopsacas minuta TaxID=111878 RepID=A0AAV7JU06_9METZ|nr:Endoplasmic reticulum-Golgi intermediate compartment protein 2-like [Oopsacas minuta]
MEIRRRKGSDSTNLVQKTNTIEIIKRFDAFPKVEEDYQKHSSSGGCITIAIILTLSLLTFFEISSFITSDLRYEYSLDRDFENKVFFNVDIVIPMSCNFLGPDLLDVAGGQMKSSSVLSEQPASFQMSKKQEKWFEKRKKLRGHTGQDLYSSLNDIFRLQAISSSPLPPLTDDEIPETGFDSCRIFGSIPVNKVSGNFHIFIGKAIAHPMGHSHLNAFIDKQAYNFSHRINSLAFGDKSSVVNPLETEIVIAEEKEMIFQYFLRVVPTIFRTSRYTTTRAYQYSVTQLHRVITPGKRQAHSGIIFKYEFDPVVVTIREREKSFWHFVIQLCGIVGGVFATSGIIHSMFSNLYEFVRKYRADS